jgi:1-acyl-sn-glycerol-3-phosphate acyltransferase
LPAAALPDPYILPAEVPRRHSRLGRWIGRRVFEGLGWRLEGVFPAEGRLVVAVAPHTSNWDFVVCAALMLALDLRLSFLGKHSLFFWPMSILMRWLGGIPVDRSSARGVVGDTLSAFADRPQLVLALAPEGTRVAVTRFRTGFLQIAHGAGVPVLLVAIDNAARTIRILDRLRIGSDIEAERLRVEARFLPYQRARHVVR